MQISGLGVGLFMVGMWGWGGVGSFASVMTKGRGMAEWRGA